MIFFLSVKVITRSKQLKLGYMTLNVPEDYDFCSLNSPLVNNHFSRDMLKLQNSKVAYLRCGRTKRSNHTDINSGI